MNTILSLDVGKFKSVARWCQCFVMANFVG